MSAAVAGRRAAGRCGAVQDEQQEAISAHAAREQTDEYSDDFESDEDGILDGSGEELHGSNESTKENIESPVSDYDTSEEAAELEDKGADDLTLSFHEKNLQQIQLLGSENTRDDRKDGEEECLESPNNRKNKECSAAEKIPCVNNQSHHWNDLPVHELQKKRNQEENKPIPKPRVHKPRNASASAQDQNMNTRDLKLEDSSRRSLFVTEGMMTTCEETRKLEKSADEMKPSETKQRVLQNPKASLSDRYLSSVHLKKKGKPAAVSSQYLGRLKVLEDKAMQENSSEQDQADSLRAAVFQNWLEKKRKLKRLEKKKAENLKTDPEKEEAVKREAAIACFEAWKKKKQREAKKLSEKKKLEELKKQEAAQQSEEKTAAAQKAFEKWKDQKVQYLREKSRKEKQSERIRKKEEEELVAEKRRNSISAVEKWNKKKEEYMKREKAEKILERRKQEIQQAKKEEKDKKALEEYERWLEKKEREQLEKKQKKLQPLHRFEVPFPWSPPGKVTYSRNY